MKLIHAWIPKKNPVVVQTARGQVARWQVCWRLDLEDGHLPKNRKATTFVTKAEAESHIKRLRKAEFRSEGWYFTPTGDPTDTVVSEHTVLDALTEYVTGRWTTVWKPNQRTKVRGRLLQLVALTVAKRSDQIRLLEGLEKFRADRGVRPLPVSGVEWAALWLRDQAFYPDSSTADPNLLAGQRWLESNSMPLSALTTKEVGRLRLHFTEGYGYTTGRTYWSGTIVPFLTWLHEAGKVERSLLLGQPVLARDMSGEMPDPSRIPDPRQLAMIAGDMGVAHGTQWELFVLLSCYCALRISEALAVRSSSFIYKKGRLWLSVNAQEHRIVAACSDDGSTKVRTGTKSTRDRTPHPRLVPIDESLQRRLEEFFGTTLGTDDTYLFLGPKGAVANDATVRLWWHTAVARVLPNDALLSGIKPHVLRHAGMTYWFYGGYDHRLIQSWGGWTSNKQMLDTYRGVLNSLEDIELDGLDRFARQFDDESSTKTLDVEPDTSGPDQGQSAQVIDLDEYRRRRRLA